MYAACPQALFETYGYNLPLPEDRVAVNQQMYDLSVDDAIATSVPLPSAAELDYAELYLNWCQRHKNILYLAKLVRDSAIRLMLTFIRLAS